MKRAILTVASLGMISLLVSLAPDEKSPIRLERKDLKLRPRPGKPWPLRGTVAPLDERIGHRLSFSSLTKEFPKALNRIGMCKLLHWLMRCPFTQAGLTIALTSEDSGRLFFCAHGNRVAGPRCPLDAGRHPRKWNVWTDFAGR